MLCALACLRLCLQDKQSSDVKDLSSPSFLNMLVHTHSGDPAGLLMHSGSLGSLALLNGSGGSLMAEIAGMQSHHELATPMDTAPGSEDVQLPGMVSLPSPARAACWCLVPFLVHIRGIVMLSVHPLISSVWHACH